jgi:hypothetical protein
VSINFSSAALILFASRLSQVSLSTARATIKVGLGRLAWPEH